MRFPIIAATFIAASVSIGTLLGSATPASAQEIITCSSQNNQRNTCSIPNRGRVRFYRQLSNASCRGNWGSRRNRIWVRNGCRAEFLVGDNRNDRYDRYDRGDRYDRNDRYDRYDRRDRYDRNDGYYR